MTSHYIYLAHRVPLVRRVPRYMTSHYITSHYVYLAHRVPLVRRVPRYMTSHHMTSHRITFTLPTVYHLSGVSSSRTPSKKCESWAARRGEGGYGRDGRRGSKEWKQEGLSSLRALPIYDKDHRWKIRIGNGFGAIWESRISLHWPSQDLNWWYCAQDRKTLEKGLATFVRAHSLPASEFVHSAIDDLGRYDSCVATPWNGEEIGLQ